MKIADGAGHIRFAEYADECPHTPGEEKMWQESFVLYAFDPQRDVYVFFRLGHIPGDGNAQVWINAWTPDYLYKYTSEDLPISTADRSTTTMSAGNGLCKYSYDGAHHWHVNDVESGVEISIKLDDHHPGITYYKSDSRLAKDGMKNHVEGTGKAIGTVVIKGAEYKLSGLGWRDHSWGKRDWSMFRAHRFNIALFDEALSFYGITFVAPGGYAEKLGVVISDGEIHFAKDFEMTSYIDYDGVSNCGGRTTLSVADKTYQLDFTPISKSVVSPCRGVVAVDSLCEVRMGNRTGVGCWEMSNNALGGSELPAIFPDSSGILANGIYRRDEVAFTRSLPR